VVRPYNNSSAAVTATISVAEYYAREDAKQAAAEAEVGA
jgi:hypothetical protein